MEDSEERLADQHEARFPGRKPLGLEGRVHAREERLRRDRSTRKIQWITFLSFTAVFCFGTFAMIVYVAWHFASKYW